MNQSDVVSIVRLTPSLDEATIGPLTVWKSYRELMAFRHSDGTGLIRRKRFSVTTSKHGGVIRRRASHTLLYATEEEFWTAFDTVLARMGMSEDGATTPVEDSKASLDDDGRCTVCGLK